MEEFGWSPLGAQIRCVLEKGVVMPIPAAPEGQLTPGSAVLALFKQVHQQLRDELSDLDDEAVRWMPIEGANPIGVIVTHILGSEAESLGTVAGLGVARDRDAEFIPGSAGVEGLLGLLDEADVRIDDLASRITPERLRDSAALPTLPFDEPRPGMTWLIGNYGHAREHVGHVQLTRQLFLVGGAPRP